MTQPRYLGCLDAFFISLHIACEVPLSQPSLFGGCLKMHCDDELIEQKHVPSGKQTVRY